jgi:pimeloyl-ACP methyl ester carboxylesterase
LQAIANRARGETDAYSIPHSHFWVTTSDGVQLAGSRLGSAEDAIVLVHGFMGYRTKKPWRRLAEGLARDFTVYIFDLRGHGQSEGFCSGGSLEANDVHAVVRYARARGHRRVVTVGGSLGGIAVVNEAATFHDSDAVVAISTPAVWAEAENASKAVRRAQRMFTTPMGRALVRRLMGTRIGIGWAEPVPPAELIDRIAPIPLLIVHGDNDHFFPLSDAQLLYERAGDPKRLLVIRGFGHAEDGFTPEFAEQLSGEVVRMLSPVRAR